MTRVVDSAIHCGVARMRDVEIRRAAGVDERAPAAPARNGHARGIDAEPAAQQQAQRGAARHIARAQQRRAETRSARAFCIRQQHSHRRVDLVRVGELAPPCVHALGRRGQRARDDVARHR
ncbi:MAG: hypothetical protein ACHP91_11275 [Burkholderiales bacterium]